MNDFVDAFQFIGRNGQVPGAGPLPSLVHLTLEHLKISMIGLALSIIIAIPVGLWLGHLRRYEFIAVSVGNLGRALPSLAVLAIGVTIFGLGLTNVEVALVVLAAPPLLINTYLGIAGVDRELVDAARGMGMSGWQVLRQVELPIATPLIFTGIRTSAVLVIATATISSLTGYSGSLGDIIANETSYHLSGVLGAAICVAALALAVEFALAGLERAVTPRGIRVAGTSEPHLR